MGFFTQVLSCRAAMQTMRVSLDRDEPGWTETTFYCPCCRDDHTVVSDSKQLQLTPGATAVPPPKHSGLPPVKRGRPEGWCRWHETASAQMAAPCAYCRTPVHVHQDAMGHVKSGHAGQGYLVQRCPACHRYNAVYPVHGKRAIRTSKLEGNAPVMQLTMGRMG